MNPYQELLKCQESFNYFASNYLNILHPKKGVISLSPHAYQLRFIEHIQKYRYTISAKFRQGGFTTISVAYAIWKCMFFKDQKIMVASKSDRESTHVSKIVNLFLERMPEWIVPKMATNSQYLKEFTVTGSRIHFGNIESVRSKNLTHLFIDEAAFIPNMNDKWKMVHPSFGHSGSVTALSTINTISDWFGETYQTALMKRNDFQVFECHYTEHPDYNNKQWVEHMRKHLGAKGFAQEMECNFAWESLCFIPSKEKLPFDDVLIENNDRLAEMLYLKSITNEYKLSNADRALLQESAYRLSNGKTERSI